MAKEKKVKFKSLEKPNYGTPRDYTIKEGTKLLIKGMKEWQSKGRNNTR